MNVSETQNSLFRQMDAAVLVATLQEAAQQAQRQAALSSLREAQRRESSVQDATQAQAGQGVAGRREQEEGRRRRRGAAPAQEGAAPPEPAPPPPGPLGRH